MIHPCICLAILAFVAVTGLTPGIIATLYIKDDDGHTHPLGPIIISLAGTALLLGTAYLLFGPCVRARRIRNTEELFIHGEDMSLNDVEAGIHRHDGPYPDNVVPAADQHSGVHPEYPAPFVCPGTSMPHNASQIVAGTTRKRFGARFGLPLGKAKKYMSLKVKVDKSKKKAARDDIEAAGASADDSIELKGTINAQPIAPAAPATEGRRSVETRVEADAEVQSPKTI